eukprot:TRINITY_DN2675_c0_g3_i1.p1 TRINITY_DN2675_c0_g3~~TRINITY_DN2675_c0_g3_i1.p1  ORF type:complete len:373 (-),score=99.97 TRINITY_DN2675_c0_g3_i1:883-1977(-)
MQGRAWCAGAVVLVLLADFNLLLLWRHYHATGGGMAPRPAFGALDGVCGPPAHLEEGSQAVLIEVEYNCAALPPCEYVARGLKAGRATVDLCVHSPEDDTIISSVLLGGEFYEPDIIADFAARLESRPTGVVIDAGANIGMYAVVAAALGHHVYAFEPFEPNALRLRQSACRNNVAQYVHLFGNALGDQRRNTTIAFPTKGNLSKGLVDYRGPLLRRNIPMVKLDDVLPLIRRRHRRLPLHLLKVDVEGFEARVLRGALHLLEEEKPPAIFMEFQPRFLMRSGCSGSALLAALVSLGYANITERATEGAHSLQLPATADHYEMEAWLITLCAVHKAADLLLQLPEHATPPVVAHPRDHPIAGVI